MILIDGYNIIHALPDLKRHIRAGDLEGARRSLVNLIAGLKFPPQFGRSCIVFDGEGGNRSGAQSGVRVVFSRHPQKADERIRDMLKKHRSGRGSQSAEQNMVVSSDRQVQSYARSEGAEWRDAGFVTQLLKKRGSRGRKHEKPDDVSPEEIAGFLKLFGEDDTSDE